MLAETTTPSPRPEEPATTPVETVNTDGGWALDLEAEMARQLQGPLEQSDTFRDAGNGSYELCPSYPALVLVPRGVDDELIRASAAFRSKQRLPSLTWHPHGASGVGSIFRCAQPLRGALSKHSAADESLLAAMQQVPIANTQPVVHEAADGDAPGPAPQPEQLPLAEGAEQDPEARLARSLAKLAEASLATAATPATQTDEATAEAEAEAEAEPDGDSGDAIPVAEPEPTDSEATAATVDGDDDDGEGENESELPASTKEITEIVDAEIARLQSEQLAGGDSSGPGRPVARHGLVIFDCRSYSAAAANSLKGGGLEDVSRYVGCKQVRNATKNSRKGSLAVRGACWRARCVAHGQHQQRVLCAGLFEYRQHPRHATQPRRIDARATALRAERRCFRCRGPQLVGAAGRHR
jgi:hypothetical protein